MSMKLKSCLRNLTKSNDFNRKFKVLFDQKNNFSFTTRLLNNVTPSNKLELKNGLVVLTVPLVIKQEKCLFSLKPVNENVGNFIDYLKKEDKGIEKVNIYTIDNLRISNNTPIGVLVQQPFKIKVNDDVHVFESLQNFDASSLDYKKDIEEIKSLVSKLYVNLNIEEHEKNSEEKILKQMESIKIELEPFEKKKELLALQAKKHTNRMIWLGLGLMSLQGGILARMTWFEYSWDIVEPISYFVTYSAIIGVYAYFVITRKEYDYQSASDRIFLRYFHKNAVKSNLDIQKYNNLRENLYNLENALKALKESNIKIDNIVKKIEN